MPDKVLMLVENLSVPADPRVWREARTLRQAGYQVCVICPKGEKRDRETHAYIEGIHIYRYQLSTTIHSSLDYAKEYLTAMVKTFWLSLWVLFQHGFDVIHAANPPDTFFVLGLLYRLIGKKYVFDQHDLAPEVFHIRFKERMRPLYKMLLLLERCSYMSAQVVITTNASQQQKAIERGGCDPKKVFIVRNGPDISRFTAVTPELELKRGRRYLLTYIGVMGVQDGVEYVLYALDILVHRWGRQDVLLVLMGSGDQLEALKELAYRLDLDDYVHFAGWVSQQELLRYLAVADIGVCPDPSNELNDHSTMLKTMEYMAMGLPIVAFDLPETRFSAQEAALYATPNQVDAFAQHLVTLLDDDQLRQRMGAYGRRRVEEELCWDRTKLNLLLAYKTLFPNHMEPEVQKSEVPAQTVLM